MATVSKGRVFVSGETVTPAKLNELVDNATVTAIQTADISDSQITTAKIADGAVTNAKIASGVDASKLTTGTLPADRIGSSAITTTRINDAAVTAAKLAPKVTFPNYGAISSLSWTSGSVIQASTDGYLLLNVVGSFMNGISVYVGTTNNPTTKIWHNGNNLNSYNWAASSGPLPLPKDTYYKIVNDDVAGNVGGFETINAFWIPAQT